MEFISRDLGWRAQNWSDEMAKVSMQIVAKDELACPSCSALIDDRFERLLCPLQRQQPSWADELH
jgi:hypothetical protein